MNQRLLGALFLILAIGWWLSPWRSRPPEPTSANVPTAESETVHSTEMSSTTKPASSPSQAREIPVQEPSMVREVQSANLPSGKEGQPLLPPRKRPLQTSSKHWNPYKTGRSLSAANGHFELLSLRAVRAENYSLELGAKIAEKNGFIVFEPSGSILPGASYAVVSNKSNGMMGFVSGIFMVQLADLNQAPSLSTQYNLILKTTDSDLNLAYLQAPQGADLTQMLASLRQDPRIEQVDLEIITSFKRL